MVIKSTNNRPLTNYTKPISVLCIILILQSIGCVFSPKKTETSYKNCELITQKLVLTHSFEKSKKTHSQNSTNPQSESIEKKKQNSTNPQSESTVKQKRKPNNKNRNSWAEQTISATPDLEALLIILVAAGIIAASTYIVSGSIVQINNTIHWLEAKGRCDDLDLIQAPATKN